LRSEPSADLSWLTEKKPYHALKENEKEEGAREAPSGYACGAPDNRTRLKSFATHFDSEQGVRRVLRFLGWRPAFSSLREYARQIDLLFPTWLQVLGADGHLQASDPETNTMFDVVQGKRPSVDAKVMTFLKAEDTEMEVYPVVQNFDGTDFVPGVVDFLNNPEARAKFRRRDRDFFFASDHYRGLMVDFESFPKKGQAGYVDLLNELAGICTARE